MSRTMRRAAATLFWTGVIVVAATAGAAVAVIHGISTALDESLEDWDLENRWHDVTLDARGPR